MTNPKRRKQNKNRTRRFLFSTKLSKRKSHLPEDLVGKFLYSVALIVMTSLVTLALAGMMPWEYVVIAFLIELLVLIVYQQFKA